MSSVQMLLGNLTFSLATAEYDKLSRTTEYRWVEHARLNRPSSIQFQGRGSTQVTVAGTIHVRTASDLVIPSNMEAEADKGEPLILLASHSANQAIYEGRWCITRVEFDEADILGDGVAQTIGFSISLKQYGEDDNVSLSLAGDSDFDASGVV